MMKTNNNKILGYYLNKLVHRVKSQYNEGYYINFDTNNYTLAPWKQILNLPYLMLLNVLIISWIIIQH